MKDGLTLPIFDQLASPGLLAELAGEAEDAGWDGVFVWDHLCYREPARGRRHLVARRVQPIPGEPVFRARRNPARP